MSEQPTPETDAFITSQDYSPTGHQWRNFTRKLERERDEAREDLEFRRGLYRVQEECLENAREQIKEQIYIAERAIALAEIDFENDKFGIVSELRSDLAKIKKSK